MPRTFYFILNQHFANAHFGGNIYFVLTPRDSSRSLPSKYVTGADFVIACEDGVSPLYLKNRLSGSYGPVDVNQLIWAALSSKEI